MKSIKAFFLLSAFVTTTVFAKEHPVDANQSQIQWTGSKVIGSSHTGTLGIMSGKINFLKNKPNKAKIIVDMNSLTNKDLEDPKWNKKLIDHLKSDDFFGVRNFPTSTLEIDRFEHVSGKKYQLFGKLTIKGKSQPVSLQASGEGENGKIERFVSSLQFDRTQFNIRYGSGKFFENLGDKMISDEIKLKVTLQMKQPITVTSH